MSRALLWGAILAMPVVVLLAVGRTLTSLLDRLLGAKPGAGKSVELYIPSPLLHYCITNVMREDKA